MLMRRYGRLPVLFWSQVRDMLYNVLILPYHLQQQLLALGFLIGCTFAPNLKTFAGLCFAC
jgi:hypothetical protein